MPYPRQALRAVPASPTVSGTHGRRQTETENQNRHERETDEKKKKNRKQKQRRRQWRERETRRETELDRGGLSRSEAETPQQEERATE